MQQGGSPYGTPPPPPPPPPSSAPAGNSSYEELAGAVAADDVLGGGGSGGSGNRWPRQETLALLKIRSEMDAAFKDATLKGPLWEEVSRKLAELGYKRSGKKCKEKFENVHKYYKRTKEGRAGRQDGKSYRFFTQLEALHTTTAAAGAVSMPAATTTLTTTSIPANFQISAPTPITTAPPPPPLFPTGISFSSNTSSSSFGSESEEEDDEATEEGPMKEGGGGKKRKREEKESGKMMAFFEGMMRQVMERQEAMQQKFLEAIEKREQDRMIREEAWRRQEMSRAAREHELAAQERAAAASRDAAILSFLQKVTGQSVPMPVPAPVPVSPVTPPAPPVNKSKSKPVKENAEVVFQQQLPPPQQQQTPPSTELVPIMSSEGAGAVAGPSSVDLASSSRWPKSEVHALINLRSELDSRYQESGPKGPLWEEISAGMKRLGYNRNAKRCKEKWENINKYFKKVKESNKKRPEDAKTCPYFHQLDVLYRRKQGSGTTSATPISMISSPPPAPPSQSQPQPQQTNDTGNTDENVEAGNGGIGSSYGDDSGILKKPEDIVKELMGQSTMTTTTTTIDYGKLDVDSENMDEDDDDEEDDEDDDDNEDGKYRIQFQRANVAANNSNGNGVGGGGGAPSNSSNTSGGKTSGSFLAMVR